MARLNDRVRASIYEAALVEAAVRKDDLLEPHDEALRITGVAYRDDAAGVAVFEFVCPFNGQFVYHAHVKLDPDGVCNRTWDLVAAIRNEHKARALGASLSDLLRMCYGMNPLEHQPIPVRFAFKSASPEPVRKYCLKESAELEGLIPGELSSSEVERIVVKALSKIEYRPDDLYQDVVLGEHGDRFRQVGTPHADRAAGVSVDEYLDKANNKIFYQVTIDPNPEDLIGCQRTHAGCFLSDSTALAVAQEIAKRAREKRGLPEGGIKALSDRPGTPSI